MFEEGSLIPFFCLVAFIMIVALLLTRSNKLGKKKRDEENNRRRDFAADFAEELNSAGRSRVVGTWEFIDSDDYDGKQFWFISRQAQELLVRSENSLAIQFHEDGTTQIGVLNARKNMFYGTQSNPLLEKSELEHMKEDLNLKSKRYLMPAYQAYEIEDSKFVHIYENNNEDEDWVDTNVYVLNDGLLYVPVEYGNRDGMYVPFERVDDTDEDNTY